MDLNQFSLLPQDVLYEVKLSGQINSAIESIISQKIITIVSTKLGIEVSPFEIQQEADKIRLANGLYKPEDTWLWLEKQGLSLDDFEYIAKRNAIAKKLAHHLFADQIKQYFISNQINYYSAAIYEIVFDDPDLAMEMFYAISEQEIDFSKVAREHCQDIHMRRSGGYKGIFGRYQLKPEFAASIFASTPPQLLKPIVTSQGAHLLFVEDIVIPKLDNTLEEKILNDLFNTWIRQQLMEIDTLEIIKNL
jgi:parvulin-like peptidyl-prolyl isomerase